MYVLPKTFVYSVRPRGKSEWCLVLFRIFRKYTEQKFLFRKVYGTELYVIWIMWLILQIWFWIIHSFVEALNVVIMLFGEWTALEKLFHLPLLLYLQSYPIFLLSVIFANGTSNNFSAQEDKQTNLNLTGGVRGEMEERWGGQKFLGSKLSVLISTRLAEEGYWSQFLGGAFVQCGDIPLMMARSNDSSKKVKVKHLFQMCCPSLITFTFRHAIFFIAICLFILQCLIRIQ